MNAKKKPTRLTLAEEEAYCSSIITQGGNELTNKKYYWLKLKDDFFNKKEIKRLRRIAGGDTYTVIYLKMLLLSLKEEGNLFFDEIGDDFIDELALELDEETDNVKMTINYLESKGLLEILSDNVYHLNELPHLVGSESGSAQRMRRHRKNKQSVIEEVSHSDALVTLSDALVTTSDTEIDIEKEKELKKETIPFAEIVEHLNRKASTKYRHTTGKTKELIRARWNEGFRLDDFTQVIDTKSNEWINDVSMNKFLRPDTLFGTKFEGYLNQNAVTKGYPTEVKRFRPDSVDLGDEVF